MKYNIPAGTEMNMKLLAKYINKHKADVARRNKKLQDAYENKYEIFLLPKKAAHKPDNRIAVNFAKYITDTNNGFQFGIPIKISAQSENVKRFVELLDKYNSMDIVNAELGKIADIHGSAHEMYFVDPAGEIGITYLSPMESFFLCDDSILERPMYFIRYYRDSENVERGSYSDSDRVYHFYNKGGYKLEDVEGEIHGFSHVPAVEYLANEEGIGIFEGAMSMINAYNKAISEKANDVDYFADAYLKVLGAKVKDADKTTIRDDRLINFTGDGERPEVDFIAKPNADETQEHLIERLERLIFQMSMVANVGDENFGTSSGIALRYKLLAMSNLFKTKERQFAAAMNLRYKTIFSNPVAKMRANDWLELSYTFTANYPKNVDEEADTAKKLDGVVSRETQLKVLSIVEDVQAEVNKIKEDELATANEIVEKMYERTATDTAGNSGTEE